MKVLVVIGTRPEAIKLAPVVRELLRLNGEERTIVCVTAQHRQMLDQVLNLFHILPKYDLDLMEENQTPTQVASGILTRLEPILQSEKPDWVLVQGDTTTAAAAALGSFYARVRIAHVEAGLRSFDRGQPFPEEVNRRVVAVLADLHFAPTEGARANLLREGVSDDSILVTGNPVIDALTWVATQPMTRQAEELLRDLDPECRIILVTAHRRENFGPPLESICLALKDISLLYQGRVLIIYPVHSNPQVWDPVHRLLGGIPEVVLVPPVDYSTLVHLMNRAYLVVTDSGGIQEEAPALGKPVLVLRDITERPEAVNSGSVRLLGTTRKSIAEGVSLLLDNSDVHQQMSHKTSPYGDGLASCRIAAALLGEYVTQFVPSPEDGT